MPFTYLGGVVDVTAELGARFNAAGKRLYLVGGIVRDQWLDLPADASADIDLTTDARPDAIKEIVEDWAEVIWTQGERFGTIGLRASGRAFEITTHRAESYTSDSRKPIVAFGDDVDVDLSRRDFTINAMAIELPAGDLVDPYGGATDLADRVLRTPLSAELSFSDDPLRMLRAARFATRFDLAIDESIVAAASSLHQRVRIVAIERIGDELARLLALANCDRGVRFLAETGVLAEVLAYGEPELIAATISKLDDGIARVARLNEPTELDWRLRVAALLSGVYGDDGAVLRACRRLRLSRDDERYVVRVVAGMQAVVRSAEPAHIRRVAASAIDLEASITLARAASTDQAPVDAFDTAYRALAQAEDLTNQEPELDGAAIMKLLDVPAGPVVGEAVTVLREHRFAHGPVSAETETDVLTQWWNQR